MKTQLSLLIGASFMAGAALLIGCGGSTSNLAGASSGGNSGASTGTNSGLSSGGGAFLSTQSTLNGKVTLPSGFALSARSGNYQVVTSLGSSPVAADGSYSVKVYSAGLQYAFMIDQSNHIVMAGRVGPGVSEISAQSTAEALAYTAVGGHYVAPDVESALNTDIHSKSQIASMKTKIESDIVARKSIADIRADVASDLTALQGTYTTRGMLVNPPDRKSGIFVDGSVTGQVSFLNSFRRRATCWIDKIGYRATEGASVTPVNPPVQIGDKFDILPTDSYAGAVGTITNAMNGSYAFSEKTQGPYDIPLDPNDAYSTTYQISTIGMGVHAGDFNSISAVRQKEWPSIAIRAVFLDLLMPVYAGIIAPTKDLAHPSAGFYDASANLWQSQFMQNFVTSILATAPNIPDLVASGDVKGAAVVMFNAVAGDGNLQAIVVELIRQQVLAQGGSLSAGVFEGAATEFLNALKVVDIGGNILDVAAQSWGIGASNQGDIWTVEVVKGKTKLKADKPVASWADLITLTTQTPDVAAGTPLEYHYVLNGPGKLYSNNAVGTDITTTDASIYLSQGGTKAVGKVSVTVQVRQISGKDRIPLGADTVTVELVDAGPTLSPTESSLLKGESDSFDVKLKPQGALSSTVYYKYSLSANLGTLDVAQNAFTTNTTVHYTAGQVLGTDTLKVEMWTKTSSGDWLEWGSATASVKVEARKSIIDATYKAENKTNSDGRYGCIAMVEFNKVPGATAYHLIGTGGFDGAYFQYGPITGDAPWLEGTAENGVTIPSGQLWHGLSSIYGGGDGSDGVAWMDSRFSGFRWKVEVTY